MSRLKKTERISFATVDPKLDYPDFLEVQLKSFHDFFQLDTPKENRLNEGLYKVFSENFPISDTRNNFVLEFLDYFIDPPRYTINECIEHGLTYGVPLKAKLKLYCTDPEHEDFGEKIQDVFFGSIPYMTPKGTFVINGAERVVVSQLHRSPGVFFNSSFHNNGTKLYSARIIPFKGAWIEFSTDVSGVIYAYIDMKKKLPITTLLRAIGYENDKDILDLFGLAEEVKVSAKTLKNCIGRKLASPVIEMIMQDFDDEETEETICLKRATVILERERVLDEDGIQRILDSGVKTILLHKDGEGEDGLDYTTIFNTLQKDTTYTEEEAVRYIYRQLRNSEAPDDATARDVIDKLFFSDKRYDLGDVGRYRLNRKLGLSSSREIRVLTKEDIKAIIKYLIKMINQKADIDDIDHLANRRVRTVGEQLAGQFSVGFARMARTIRERMNVRDNEVFSPSDLINAKTLSSVLNSFFGSNPLSQFMDQINPLAEVTHKRRLSALGPGGLSRERAGFEVRDVHYTHYGRLCPIETPEGPNIGLISSLCVYAKISDMGFIETPYAEVKNGKVTSKVKYLSAEQEEGLIIAQANSKLNPDSSFANPTVKSRQGSDFPNADPSQVDMIDVAPNQIASIAASLIPFLEHDDANRALMGSNMMRQAVPLLKPEAPIVGTGLEAAVVADSRTQVVAERDGEVVYSDSKRIEIEYQRTEFEEFTSFDPKITVYNLPKYQKTNQSTCQTLRPIVRRGDKVKAGQILTEGYSTDNGELALGRNLKVAYMPWQGYNFEDAIVISERLVREDLYTSVHVDEFIMEVRETKRGAEELTSDIPNVSEDATKDLDERGIIRIGATVKPNDILIGKITPKGETDPSPEEKLLRAIFGEKAGDVKDASLRAEPSLYGVVIDRKLFTRAVKEGGKKGLAAEKAQYAAIDARFAKSEAALRDVLIDKLWKTLKGKQSAGVSDYYGVPLINEGVAFTKDALKHLDYLNINPVGWSSDQQICLTVSTLINNFLTKWKELKSVSEREKFAVTNGDELAVGILKMAKVYVAKKRKLRVGDKMAGRHGNKGIVAKVVRDEDMPFLDDGSIVDIVLNPLGVPSRMNLGQIYEAVLGWAGRNLGVKFATPIFDGATLEQINEYTAKAGVPRSGMCYLYDGRTGEKFDQPATVGVTYFLKLGHMVDDKMHARSIGPYSLITQQPLGGKAQFGGQRFGEMEVWALEAFGASHILQEILTIKSDDVNGRAKAYEAIVKGENLPEAGIPESLNVLLHELMGLGLNIELK